MATYKCATKPYSKSLAARSVLRGGKRIVFLEIGKRRECTWCSGRLGQIAGHVLVLPLLSTTYGAGSVCGNRHIRSGNVADRLPPNNGRIGSFGEEVKGTHLFEVCPLYLRFDHSLGQSPLANPRAMRRLGRSA